MKKYSDLSSLQKDFAVDSALRILLNKLVDEDFDYKFKSPLAQKHFHDGMYKSIVTRTSAINYLLNSDEIAEELYPIAESMAEIAYYPNADETVIKGIVKQ